MSIKTQVTYQISLLLDCGELGEHVVGLSVTATCFYRAASLNSSTDFGYPEECECDITKISVDEYCTIPLTTESEVLELITDKQEEFLRQYVITQFREEYT